MKRLSIRLLIIYILAAFACTHPSRQSDAQYIFHEPSYVKIGLLATQDSLVFNLDDSTYNDIESSNTFVHNNQEYLSLFDQRSKSVNIYSLETNQLRKKVLIAKNLPKQKLYKATVFCKSFDSIFVNNFNSLYLMDSNATIKKRWKFAEDPPLAWAYFKNANPATIQGNYLFAAVRPLAKETSLSAIGNWKTIYRFDLQKKETSLHYSLPGFYGENFFGQRLMESSYCVNEQGHFVISFAADHKIYQTDLDSLHQAYYGKSKFLDSIVPVPKRDLENDEGFAGYLLRDSYGGIYYDRFTKRYLRIAKARITKADYNNKNYKKKQSLVIFDKDLKIIGESPVDVKVSLNYLLITSKGKIYARTDPDNEYAVKFIRLDYNETPPSHQIATK